MEKKLYYLKIVNGEKTLNFNRKLKEGELDKNSTCQNFRQVQKEGNKSVLREIKYMSLQNI